MGLIESHGLLKAENIQELEVEEHGGRKSHSDPTFEKDSVLAAPRCKGPRARSKRGL